MFTRSFRSPLVAVALILLLTFAPVHQAEAKGGVSFGGILRLVATAVVAAVVVAYCTPCAQLITTVQNALSVVQFSSPLAVGAWNTAVSLIGSVALGAYSCSQGSTNKMATAPFEGCGGGGGSGQGNEPAGPAVLSQQVSVSPQAPGAQLSCTDPAYPQLCGVSSCIPANSVCCSSVGYADRYCPSTSFCTTDGQCEATTGGQNCSGSYNQACTSSTNSCGMTNSGFHSCTGTCQAVTPADNTCPTPGITLTQTPAFVNVGDTCAVTWSTTNTTACSLVNLTTNTTVASGKNGNYVTPPLNVQNDFRLNCSNGSVVASHANISCRINPSFQEN